MIRAVSFILATLCTSLLMIGQQTSQWSQYMMNHYETNPAYAGLDFSLSLTAAYRSQWSGLDGRPSSRYLGGHIPLYIVSGAVGAEIMNEQFGNFRHTRVAGSFNYILDNTSGLLSLGAKLGIQQSSISGDGITTPDGNYEGGIINHNDPILPLLSEAGLGLYYSMGAYYMSRYFDVGYSLSSLPAINISIDQVSYSQEPAHYLLIEGKLRTMDLLFLKPSVLVKSDQNLTQIDFNVLAEYNGSIFGGVGLRGYHSSSFDAMVFIVGTEINKNYTVSYSFDTGISSLKRANEGSHEIILNYNLNKLIGQGIRQRIIYNPRHL